VVSESELTVLIIDEHLDISPLLAGRLGRVPGVCIVGETANVMLGAELAHQLEPQVILADFRRTGPPRVETYRWLSRVSPASRLIAHTSYLAEGEEESLRGVGVVAYLKGMSMDELADRLREAVTDGSVEVRREGRARPRAGSC
jgi:two-component system vancomycin resistance associated response regulator VraR